MTVEHKLKVMVPAATIRSVNRLRSGDLTVAFDVDRQFAEDVKELMDVPDSMHLRLYVVDAYPGETDQADIQAGGRKMSERQKIVWQITRVIEDELGWDEATKKKHWMDWFKVESRSEMTMDQLTECYKRVKDEAWRQRGEQHDAGDDDDVEGSDAKSD